MPTGCILNIAIGSNLKKNIKIEKISFLIYNIADNI
jgi:hypothetical protein